MLKSMKQLGGPKKPASKATPEQIKMANRLKDIQSKQRNSPEGKAFTQEMLAKSKKASEDMKAAALARREKSDANIDEMGRQAMQSIEDKYGEEKFGPDYKGMGLSVGRKRKPGQPSERTYFKDQGEDNREDIEKMDDGSIRVTRQGKYATFADLEPTEREEYSEPGRRVYRTSVKEYAKKQQEALKARAKYLMNQAQPQLDKIKAEIEAAKSKAGGNK